MKKSLGTTSTHELTTRLQPTVPKWLRTSNPTVQGKGTEMVSLPRDSPLSKLPTELQLLIIFFLPYTSVLTLKETSRYFHYFLTPNILMECKQIQIARWAEKEAQGGWPDEFPCYFCLQLKNKYEFYKNGMYATTIASPGSADTTRHCILCSFRNNEYEPSTCLTINGETKVLCANCGELATLPLGTNAKVCIPCKISFDNRQENGTSLRFIQLFFTIVSWALSCSGKLPPRTSVPDKKSVRFIFQSLLVSLLILYPVCAWMAIDGWCHVQSLITLSATCNSILIRGETKKWHGYRTKRSQNGKFIFHVELVGFICWTAILAAVLNEGATLHLTGRFDKIAKAMVAMLFFQCICFAGSAWWGYKTSLVRRRVVRRFGRVPEVLV